MNRKKLYIIFATLIVLIIVLGIILTKSGSVDSYKSNTYVDTKFSNNNETLVDYGSNVVKYGSDVYILDENSNSIIRYDNTDKKSKRIVSFSNNEYGKEFFIRSNHLLYSMNNTTYYCDLDGDNKKQMTDGEIIYIDDDYVLLINHDSVRDVLTIKSYDKQKLNITNSYYKELAKGNVIKFVKTDNKNVYLTSTNKDNIFSLFVVDISNFKVSIISRKDNNDIEAGYKEYSVADVLQDEENYYYTVFGLYSNSLGDNQRGDPYLYVKGKNVNNEELMCESVGYYLAKDPKDDKRILYEYIDPEDNYKSVWKYVDIEDSEYSWKDLLHGDVSAYFSFSDSDLFKEDELLVKFDYQEYYDIMKVVRLDDGYYINTDSPEGYSWYYCTEKGENLTKIH